MQQPKGLPPDPKGTAPSQTRPGAVGFLSVMGRVGGSVLLMVAALAVLASGAVQAIHPSGADFEERRRVLSALDLTKEIHYAHSWGYETPPPPEIAPYVLYFPPKKYGTEKHRRELRALITLRSQATESPSSPPPPPPEDDVFFDPDTSDVTTDDPEPYLKEPAEPEYPVGPDVPPDVINSTYNTLQVYGTVPKKVSRPLAPCLVTALCH